ncbi:hypothetical protein HW555_003758 [Spodoptera exigua]|uniref:BPTI/Kunitz inhibitor domain-containing protein n=1 Tax=Spodoptera exigua TaxID=7107 RepID=A0A835GLD4_SPOEX|nr:hypothetical protein HW555_003758 [Spodoptera exigua]
MMKNSVTALTHFLDELHSLDWQFLCKMQPNGYDCSNANDSLQYRFYYDVLMNACKTYQYGLCDLNMNSFHTLRECADTCDGKLILLYCSGVNCCLKMIKVKLSDDTICRLQHDFGSCENYYPMWYYDVTERTCKSFSYSGCGGNENRFPTSGHCNTRCQPAVGEYKRIKTLLD